MLQILEANYRSINGQETGLKKCPWLSLQPSGEENGSASQLFSDLRTKLFQDNIDWFQQGKLTMDFKPAFVLHISAPYEG